MRRLEAATTWLFLKREYLTRVRTRSFIISTLVLPVLLAAMVTLPALATGRTVENFQALTHRPERMVVVCADQSLASDVRDRLIASPRGSYTVQISADLSGAERARLGREIAGGRLDAFLWLDPSAVAARRVDLVTANPEDYMLRGAVASALWWAITGRQLAGRGIASPDVSGLLARVHVETRAIGLRHPVTDTLRAIAVVTVLTTMMIITLLSYGVMVMRSVMEEKNSRITEILLCYASAEEMMAGKIVGVGAAGLTQITIWAAIAAATAESSTLARQVLAQARIGPAMVLGFVIFYVLGYTLYSSVFAAVGAAFNSQDEAQQWNFIIVMPLIAGSLMVTAVVSAPSSFASVVMSMLPIWSPLLMYARIIVSRPPVWQVALSLALLVATVLIAIEACARIYRVGLLMYGKRPTTAEIMRWLRYT
jgi:ABC-2 type transport system permease protein